MLYKIGDYRSISSLYTKFRMNYIFTFSTVSSIDAMKFVHVTRLNVDPIIL